MMYCIATDRLLHAAAVLAVVFSFAGTAGAQMPRERVDPGGPVDELFWAPRLITLPSVTNLGQGDLDVTIKHSFGIVEDGVTTLFGLDAAANIRFGVDYGISDWLSLGVGRSRFDKLYDFRAKANVLRQKKDESMPVEVAVAGNVAVTTLENGFDLADRLSYNASLLLARRFNDRLSLQVTPTFGHFNTVFRDRTLGGEIIEEENDLVGIGFGGRIVLSPLVALLAEYVPVIGDRSDGTEDAVSVGFDLETGGHVFQLFFTTTQWTTVQHVLGRNRDQFFDGDIRFGFNVHRRFNVGPS